MFLYPNRKKAMVIFAIITAIISLFSYGIHILFITNEKKSENIWLGSIMVSTFSVVSLTGVPLIMYNH